MSFIRRKGEKCNKKSPPHTPCPRQTPRLGMQRSTSRTQRDGAAGALIEHNLPNSKDPVKSFLALLLFLQGIRAYGTFVSLVKSWFLFRARFCSSTLRRKTGKWGKTGKIWEKVSFSCFSFFNAGKISFFFSPPISMEDFCSMRNTREAARGSFLLS